MERNHRKSKNWVLEGVRLANAKNYVAAVAAFSKAKDADPRNVQAWRNLGAALKQIGEVPGRRIQCYLEALRLQDDPYTHANLAAALLDSGDWQGAAKSARKACESLPNYFAAWLNLGHALAFSGDIAGAQMAYERALTIDLQNPDALHGLGALFQQVGKYEEAAAILGRAEAISPENHRIGVLAIRARQQIADWSSRNHDETCLKYWLKNNFIGIPPFNTLAFDALSGDDHRKAANLHSIHEFAEMLATPSLVSATQRADKKRALRVGYLTADLRDHVIGRLMGPVLQAGDTRRHEVYVYDIYPRQQNNLRRHIEPKITSWQNLSALSWREAATKIAEDHVDILVDMTGYTAYGRTGILAYRPCPIQINFLGYPASMGNRRVADYVFADAVTAPVEHWSHFEEEVVRLDGSFIPPALLDFDIPSKRRSDLGLPESGLILAAFHNGYKLTPKIFADWMMLLHKLQNAILWLLVPSQAMQDRMIRMAHEAGIAPERLIFYEGAPYDDYLAALSLADLFLDSQPYGAGGTARDALLVGVPIVTALGDRLCGRMAASVCYEQDVRECVAQNPDEYFDRALVLAQNTDLRREIKARLLAQRALAKEKVRAYAKNLDNIYFRLAERHGIGLVTELPITESIHAQANFAYEQALIALNQGSVLNAKRHLENAIALAPEIAIYHANLGVVLKALGVVGERIACYERAIALAPHEGNFHSNLASVLNECFRHVEAETSARRALDFAPERPESWFNLGISLTGQQRWEEAAESFDAVARYRSPQVVELKAAGEAWFAANRYPEALARFDEALRILTEETPLPERLSIVLAKGRTLSRWQRYAEATGCLREALRMGPDSEEVLTELGVAYKQMGLFDDARNCFERVIVLRPNSSGGHNNLGIVEQSRGQHDTAIGHYRDSLTLDPQLEPVWTNLSNCMTYSSAYGPSDVLKTLKEYDELLAKPLASNEFYANDRNPIRRLKLGYVSPDFRKHAVAYFALPLIEGHLRDQVEVFCYYNHHQNDEWTARFRKASDHWMDCLQMNDRELAEQIRSDEIDVLIDLAGHTENNRLLVFARKPAPVQVTWMGYVTTTGLSAMTWRVTHIDADPPGSESFYSEKLWRLPGTMWCYRPLPQMPDVSPAPNIKNGYITFGSFNRYSKISTLVLEAWATILSRVPKSRLIMCVPESEARDQVNLIFGRLRIEAERISFFPQLSHEDFWRLHAEVDIALDPFPFGGGTTTCETLWLGVPVVTVTGRNGGDFEPRFASRMGYAFLKNIGLPDLACESMEDYTGTAVSLANSPERLSVLRRTLRPRMVSAPLTDERRFVFEMEAAFRAMWQDWLKTAKNAD